MLMPHWTDIGFWRRLIGSIALILLLQAGAVQALTARPSPASAAAAVDSFFDDFSLNQKDQNVRKHRFANLPITLRGKSEKARLHPRSLSITILGPAVDPAEKAALKKKIIAYIDLARIRPGVYVKPAKIRLPPGYVLLDAKPEIFVVEVRDEK